MGNEGIIEDDSTFEEVREFHKSALQTIQFQVMVEWDSCILDIAANIDHLSKVSNNSFINKIVSVFNLSSMDNYLTITYIRNMKRAFSRRSTIDSSINLKQKRFRNKTSPRNNEGLGFSYFSLVKKIFWQNTDGQVSFDQPRSWHPLDKLNRVWHEEHGGVLIHGNIRTGVDRQVSDSCFLEAWFVL